MPYIKKLVLKGFKSFAKETEVPFINSMNVIVGANGSGKSARWDTEVLLASGDKKPIGKIVEESLKKSKVNEKINDGILTKENPLGIKVLGINPETMKIEKSEITAFIKREGEPNLYTIQTKTGKEVTTTSCHPVMIYRNGRIVSEIVENLKQGDFIATPNKIEIPEDNKKISLTGLDEERANSKEFARFLGYIVGDGCIIKNSRIDFVNADIEILEDYQRTINYLGFKSSLASIKKSIAKNVYLYSKTFANSLISFFNNNYKKEKKHMPIEILFGKKEILKNFLAALFDCDSSVRKDNPTFEYVTMSEELANNVLLGLLRFGIVARKTKKLKYASNTKLKNKKEYFFIVVEGKEKIYQFYENIPLRCVHKKELIKKWAENNVVPNTNNDLLPLEINKEIKNVFNLLGIKLKPLRKEYPFLTAYVENRCNASRRGMAKIIPLIQEKISVLTLIYDNLCLNQSVLVKSMLELNISGQEASRQIGLHPSIIMRDWAPNRFQAKQENLENFYKLIKNALEERILKIKIILNLLKNLAYSDIFWDRINKIEKVKGEEWVYDLCVEKNHNFIANNIFVHNSNLADAICFVLGRISAKSIRAEKSANLIFTGTKEHKPSSEASVKLVFDNSDKKISLPENEVAIERAVRNNGQSIYKINNETKTRQEILELLSQAGIDPYGFNIVLQGEIDSIVKMHPEERRKVIEEVAGISVYEFRKEKSLRELEKTEEKLKEVGAILRERTSYLRNLEEERKQALKFQKLQELEKKCKASIIKKKLDEKIKLVFSVEAQLQEKEKNKNSLKENSGKTNNKVEELKNEINIINSSIQSSSGIEREQLHNEISDIRAELAGLDVRKENNESKIEEILARKNRGEEEIKKLQETIEKLRKEFPSQAKKYQEIETKKKELGQLEKEKKNFYNAREKLNLIKDREEEKLRQFHKNKNETNFILKEVERIAEGMLFKEIRLCEKEIIKLKNQEEETIKNLSGKEKEILEQEKLLSSYSTEISSAEKIKNQVSSLDICPLCKSKITPEHIKEVFNECDNKISFFKKRISEFPLSLKEEAIKLEANLRLISEKSSKAGTDLLKLQNIEEKKEKIKKLSQELSFLENEINNLKNEKKNFDIQLSKFKNIEDKYDKIFLEIQDISSRTQENMDVELEAKEREIGRLKISIKQSEREEQDLKEELLEIENLIEENEKQLKLLENDEKELEKKFHKLIERKNSIERDVNEQNSLIFELNSKIAFIENEINDLRISKARVDAEKEAFETDYLAYKDIELLSMSLNALEEKLKETQTAVNNIGSVNLRALEVYDKVKEEYDVIAGKVSVLEQEKQEILKIIEEIDRKKKKTFMKTLNDINELFKRNFSQLFTLGQVSLELENTEEETVGLDIMLKLGHGKYIDASSLSGGEKALVALSLIFAIQEYKPYSFYIFDEVDAALDKRNSERVTALIKRYMQTGQYIIITHNDAIITESAILYGVSKQEGISRIFSLEI